MDSTTITLRGFRSTTLVSDPGGVIDANKLKGPFHLEVTFTVIRQGTPTRLKMSSDTFQFTEATGAMVVMENGGPTLDALASQAALNFSTPTRIQSEDSDLWLQFNTIILAKSASKEKARPYLSDLVVSLVPDQAMPPATADKCRLFFTTDYSNGSYTSIRLSYLGSSVGLPLLEVNETVSTTWDALAKRLTIGWSGLSLDITNLATFSLSFGATNGAGVKPRLEISPNQNRPVAFLKASGASGARIGRDFDDEIMFSSIACAGGRLQADRNANTQMVAKVSNVRAEVSNPVMIGGPEEFSFVLGLAGLSGAKPATRAALIRSNTFQPSLAETPAHRRNGIRMAGLPTASGVDATLDCDLAIFEFRNVTGGLREFHLRAGGEVDIPFVGKKTSVLVPKFFYGESEPLRRIRIPCGQLMIESCYSGPGSATCFELDTFGNLEIEGQTASKYGFVIRRGDLILHPGGTRAAASGARGAAAEGFWSWKVKSGMGFSFRDGVIFPTDGDNWTKCFVAQSGEFKSKEYPGTILSFPSGSAGFQKTTDVQTLGYLQVDGIDVPRYEKLSVSMTYGPTVPDKFAIRADDPQVFVFDKDVAWILPNLKPKSNGLIGQLEDANSGFLAANGIDNLLIGWCRDQGSGQDIGPGFAKFVDDLFEKKDPKKEKTCLWGLGVATLGLEMRTKGGDGTVYYGDRIIIDRNKDAANPVLVNDSSTPKSILDCSEWFDAGGAGGYANKLKASIALWQDKYPELWSKQGTKSKAARENAALDPSMEAWRGVFYADFPAQLKLPPPTVGKQFPFISKLFEQINNNLVVKFGWKDGDGNTWAAELPEQDIELTPPSWRSIMRVKLKQFSARARKNKVVSAAGKLAFAFPFLHKKSDEPTWCPVDFVVNLTTGTVTLNQIVIDYGKNKIIVKTKLIPGFKEIQICKLSTNLETFDAVFQLIADDELKKSVPIMGGEDGLRINLHLILGEAVDESALSFGLPNAIDFNLFGKWHMTLEGILVSIAKESNNLTGRGSLSLGGTEFLKVGGGFLIGQKKKTDGDSDGDWDFDVRIDNVGAAIGFGDMKAEILVGWADPSSNWATPTPPPPSPVAQGTLGQAGNTREFLGVFRLLSEGVFKGKKQEEEKLMMAVRFGNVEERSYWIAALRYDDEIGFGPSAKIDKPMLVIGRGVDAGKNLANAVTTGKPGTFKKFLRPQGDVGKWLVETWNPPKKADDSSVAGGLVLAASGFLGMDSSIAGKPSDEEHLTSLLFTESGLFRIDAFLNLFNAIPVSIGIGLDAECKFMSFQIQVGKFKVGEIEINGGLLRNGFRYGTPTNPRCKGHPIFDLRIGWPEKKDDDPFENDWDQSIKVIWDALWPINTFWGGMLVTIGDGYVIHGQAAKVGWSKSYDFIGGLGTAYVEVSVGGMLIYKHEFGDRGSGINLEVVNCPRNRALCDSLTDLAQFRHIQREGGISDRRLECLAVVTADLQELVLIESARGCLEGRLFLDIKGGASVSLFGIELVGVHIHAYARATVCGIIDWGTLALQIKRIGAKLGFTFKVRIGCFEYSAEGSLPIWLKNDPCDCSATLREWQANFADYTVPYLALPPISETHS